MPHGDDQHIEQLPPIPNAWVSTLHSFSVEVLTDVITQDIPIFPNDPWVRCYLVLSYLLQWNKLLSLDNLNGCQLVADQMVVYEFFDRLSDNDKRKILGG